MTKAKIRQKLKHYQVQRQYIVTPNPSDDLTADEMDGGVQLAMQEFAEDCLMLSWCYVVHTDKDYPDTYSAMTGLQTDLYLDREDVEQERQRVHKQIRPALEHEAEPEYNREERQQDRGADRGPGWSR